MAGREKTTFERIDVLQLSPHGEDEKNAEVQDEYGPVDRDVHYSEESEDE